MDDDYRQFVDAAKTKDVAAPTPLIRNHKELHDYAGDDGSLSAERTRARDWRRSGDF